MENLFHTESFATLVDSLPGFVWFKDCNFNYAGCNQRVLNLTCSPHKDDVLGQSDYNLPWAKYADLYRSNDQLVLTTEKPHSFIQPALTFDGQPFLIVSRKSPFRDIAGNLIGIAGSDTLLQAPKTAQAITNVSQADFELISVNSSDCNQYMLCDDFSQFGLTEREAHCLFHLIRGKTSKEIANRLHISKRTVEHHINNIRNKFNCRTKSDIIDKAIALNFIKLIPSCFLPL